MVQWLGWKIESHIAFVFFSQDVRVNKYSFCIMCCCLNCSIRIVGDVRDSWSWRHMIGSTEETEVTSYFSPPHVCANKFSFCIMGCCVKCSVTTTVDLRISWSRRQMTELTEETENHIAFSFPPHVCSTSKYSFCIMRCCGKCRRRGQLELRRQMTELIV